MSAPLPHVGRPVLDRAADAVRAWARDPILRRVVGVGLLGVLLAGAVVFGLAGNRAVLRGIDLPTAWLLPGLVVLTCLAEIAVVRLRHGDAVEELSLYEAALVVDVLLLPPRDALIAAVAGLVIASAVQRRPLIKAAFNLGTYTAAMAVLILAMHAIGDAPGTVTVGVLVGVVVGTFAFTIVNLCCLAQILAVINDVSWWTIVRAEARLSAYMAVGTVATGLTTTVIGLEAPLLLPFMAMPALAVTYAYRAAAREAEERVRSACLLRLSHALAEREDVVRQFLLLVREAFNADLAVVALDGPNAAWSVSADQAATVRPGEVPGYLAAARDLEGPVQLTENLPAGLRQLVVVPVEGGGRRLGTAAFGTRDRGRLSTGDITLLASLASTLAVAMRGAEHLNRLTEETSKLQAVVEQSAEGILVIDGDGVVEMWNRALTDLTGIDAAGAAGRHLADLLDVPAEEERELLVPVSVEVPRAATDLSVRGHDGEEHRLRMAHSAVFAGHRMLRDVIVISDLTREYRTERLKSDFIAMVSHELRTPLTPIIGYVDLLRRRGERMTPQKRADALDLIGDRAAHLSRMVEDLLLASRFGDNPDDVSLEVVTGSHDAGAIVAQAVQDLGSDRITATLPDGPVSARCDSGRTLQIVTNLVGNGLKYSAEDQPVEVTLEHDDEQVRVVVRDHGRGIPADAVDKVFEKFYRVEDPMTMSTSGTGLGLFIARRLARAMGGDVTVESAPNVGSVFTLALRR
ncbi:ATP-binding protein [Jidongwangia harbinensis]|uniref:ATP-binding protein n=1 Tax=Jidongwangia harbinensis TaxID=2878561 RepID=UPI001CD98FB6|nr:ATP-binding protein [Jidongwangia harbinensis]MCA2213316.1 PAS domain S-box protein [Jidongwangia harbinensis]